MNFKLVIIMCDALKGTLSVQTTLPYIIEDTVGFISVMLKSQYMF